MRRVAVILLLLGAAMAPLHAQAPARSGPHAAEAAALARQTFVTLPAPPPWDAAANASFWTIEEIQAEFAKATDTPPQVNFVRTRFLQPDHTWVTRFKTWFRTLEKPLKLRVEDQLWDCDNYANCFVAFADLLALRGGEARGTFCVGWATVYYRRPFAGVRRGAHAVAIVGTNKGLFVIEPQDGTMIALREFPNRDTIEAVYF